MLLLFGSSKTFIELIPCEILNRFCNEILDLPLAGIEAVLSSDDIRVAREDDVYDLVLKWAQKHYPQLNERREILDTRLCHLIRFRYMTNPKLQEATADANFSPGVEICS